MKYDHMLPIGSLVKVYGVENRLLIIGSNMADEETGRVYDYCGCFYPVGFLGGSRVANFNHDDIEILYSVGLLDEESINVQKEEEEINRRARENASGV